MNYLLLTFKKWNDIDGRASRSEYWYFFSFYLIVIFILGSLKSLTLSTEEVRSFLGIDPDLPIRQFDKIIYVLLSFDSIIGVFYAITFFPSLSLTIRRLHDVDESGWNILWILTIFGSFYLLYLHTLKGTEGDNRYGSNSFKGNLKPSIKPKQKKPNKKSVVKPKVDKNPKDSNKKAESENYIKDDDVQSQGSGVIISKDGIIATNNHVIEGAKNINIQMLYGNDIQDMNAKLLRSNPNNDLAILKIDDKKFKGFDEIPFVIKNSPEDVATEVYALGFPLALSILGTDVKFSEGRISSKSGFQGDVTTYQISNPIQPGNSGGPLFNHQGEVVGIVSAKVNSNAADNVGYAIKSSHLFTFIDALPQEISLNTTDNLISEKSLPQQIKLVKDFVVMIKVEY